MCFTYLYERYLVHPKQKNSLRQPWCRLVVFEDFKASAFLDVFFLKKPPAFGVRFCWGFLNGHPEVVVFLKGCSPGCMWGFHPCIHPPPKSLKKGQTCWRPRPWGDPGPARSPKLRLPPPSFRSTAPLPPPPPRRSRQSPCRSRRRPRPSRRARHQRS